MSYLNQTELHTIKQSKMQIVGTYIYIFFLNMNSLEPKI